MQIKLIDNNNKNNKNNQEREIEREGEEGENVIKNNANGRKDRLDAGCNCTKLVVFPTVK